MAVLKILILFLLIGKEAKLVRCQVSDEYYYADESSEKTESNPPKMSSDNELTHVRTKNLSGNVKLTTLQVLTTNTPLDKLNNEFENEVVDILDEATEVLGTWNENKQDEVQTIPEIQQNVALLSELRTKAPTDGTESFGLMDVFNSTSGTLPDQAGTEKLITVTQLNFQLIREEPNSTPMNLPEKAATDYDEFEKILGANSARTADSETFTEQGTTAEVTFIDGITTSMVTDIPGRNTVSPDDYVNERNSASTAEFMTTHRNLGESGVNKSEEMETSSTFQPPRTVMTTLYQDQTERTDSVNSGAFTTPISDLLTSTLIISENNVHEKINSHLQDKYLDSEHEITTEDIRAKLSGLNLIISTARNLDQSHEEIENLSSFIDVDEELLKSVLDENEDSISSGEIIEDVAVILDDKDSKEQTTSGFESKFQYSTTANDDLITEYNNEQIYSTTSAAEQIPTITTKELESQNPTSTSNFEKTTEVEGLETTTTLRLFKYSSTPTTIESMFSSNTEVNGETTASNYQNIQHTDEFTTSENNIFNEKTTDDSSQHTFIDKMTTDSISTNSAITSNFGQTTEYNFKHLDEETTTTPIEYLETYSTAFTPQTSEIVEYTPSPSTTQEFTFTTDTELVEKTTPNNNGLIKPLDGFTTVLYNTFDIKTADDLSHHTFTNDMVTNSIFVNSASTSNFEQATEYKFNHLEEETATTQNQDLETASFKPQTTLEMFGYSSTPPTTQEFTFISDNEFSETTTANVDSDLQHVDDLTTRVNNILYGTTTDDFSQHISFGEMMATNVYANSESTPMVTSTSELPTFSVTHEEEQMDRRITTDNIFRTMSLETTTNNKVFVDKNTGSYRDGSTTDLFTESTEDYTTKHFQETHYTTAESQIKNLNEVTDVIITSGYLFVKNTAVDGITSSVPHEEPSTTNDFQENGILYHTRSGKELVTMTEASSTGKYDFFSLQTEQNTDSPSERTPTVLSTTTMEAVRTELTTFSNKSFENEEQTTNMNTMMTDRVTAESGIITDVSASNASEIPSETTISLNGNINEFSTVKLVTENENDFAGKSSANTVATIDEFNNEEMTRSTVAITSRDSNEQTISIAHEDITTYGGESTTTSSYDEKMKEELINLLKTGLTSFFETFMAEEIETPLPSNNDNVSTVTDTAVDHDEVTTIVRKSDVKYETNNEGHQPTTVMYSLFKENTNIINENINFEEVSEKKLVIINFDKTTTSTLTSEEGFESVTKDFITMSKYFGDELNKMELETSTFSHNPEDSATTITQSIRMSTIVDSLINTGNTKEESHIISYTPSGKMKIKETEPQVTAKMDDRTLYFSIKITDNETSFFVPSDAFLTVLSPNTVNITWKSATMNMNNSLQLTIGNSVQLNVVKGTQMHIYKTALIPEHENKLDVDTNLITMDDGIKIYFSNTEFLRKDQKNQNAFTADALPSAPTQTEVLAAEIIGGCIGLFVIASILIYCVIKKYRAKTRNFKPNNSA